MLSNSLGFIECVCIWIINVSWQAQPLHHKTFSKNIFHHKRPKYSTEKGTTQIASYIWPQRSWIIFQICCKYFYLFDYYYYETVHLHPASIWVIQRIIMVDVWGCQQSEMMPTYLSKIGLILIYLLIKLIHSFYVCSLSPSLYSVCEKFIQCGICMNMMAGFPASLTLG